MNAWRKDGSSWSDVSFHSLSALVYLANAQTVTLGSCPPITVNDLGSTTDFSSNGLVSSAARPRGGAGDSIPVRIINYHNITVSEAPGMSRNTSSFASELVQFQCNFPI